MTARPSPWRSANGNYIPDCDLSRRPPTASAARMDNQNFGKDVFTKSFDPDSDPRLGQAHLQLGDGHLRAAGTGARVGSRVGYFRRWFGNFYTANNRLTTTADYTRSASRFRPTRGCRRAVAARSRGCTTSCPAWSAARCLLAAVLELRRDDRELAGLDVSVNARLRNGLTCKAPAPLQNKKIISPPHLPSEFARVCVCVCVTGQLTDRE
jgi:hypothetical protein